MCVLIMLEPNMSITLCVGAVCLIMLLVGGARIKHLVMLSIPVMALIPVLIFLEPYRIKRLMAFLDPWASPQGEGFQLIQSLFSLGSGGWFGVGLFQSRAKYSYLPFECNGDDFLIGSIRPLLEFHVYKNICKIHDSIVFINHPFTLIAMLYGGFKKLQKKNSVILLSHDIDFLRGYKKRKAAIIKELQSAACIIVHNEKYAEFLIKEGITTPTVPLHIFDYLLPDIQKLPPKTLTRKISFVGNLTKSAFIQIWIQQDKTYWLFTFS